MKTIKRMAVLICKFVAFCVDFCYNNLRKIETFRYTGREMKDTR